MFVFLVLHALALTDYASLSGPTGWFPGRVIVVAETPEEEAAARKNPVVDAVAPFLYDVVATNSTPFHDFAVAEGFAEGPRDYAVFSLESLTPLYQFPQTFAEILGNFTLERGLRGVFLNNLETVYNAFGRSRRAVRRVVAEVGDFLHAHGVELFVILPLDRKVFDYAQLKRAVRDAAAVCRSPGEAEPRLCVRLPPRRGRPVCHVRGGRRVWLFPGQRAVADHLHAPPRGVRAPRGRGLFRRQRRRAGQPVFHLRASACHASVLIFPPQHLTTSVNRFRMKKQEWYSIESVGTSVPGEHITVNRITAR